MAKATKKKSKKVASTSSRSPRKTASARGRAPAKRAAVKKATAKRVAKRPLAKKAVGKKAAKKVVAKKAVAKKAAKKVVAKRAVAKKAAKRAVAKKAAKKVVAKKAVGRRTSPPRSAPRRKNLRAPARNGRPDGAAAFLPDPTAIGHRRVRDDFAEELGEEFVSTATSGESVDDARDAPVPEEDGGPFVTASARSQYGSGTDESNPVDAEREPFPTTHSQRH
jgi:hypothetical protein